MQSLFISFHTLGNLNLKYSLLVIHKYKPKSYNEKTTDISHTAFPSDRATISVSVNGRATRKSLVIVVPWAIDDCTCERIRLRKSWETMANETQTPRGQLFFLFVPCPVIETGACVIRNGKSGKGEGGKGKTRI